MTTTLLFHFLRLASALVILVIFCANMSASPPLEAVWQALQKGEAVALIRHAEAPGTGDPPGFMLGDCSTQHNLSTQGRSQSRRIGDFFRSHGITSASVHASQWCRCLETAHLLELGPVEELPALNSFFAQPAREPAQTAELRALFTTLTREVPSILVTHQVNITALTGVFPPQGKSSSFAIAKTGATKSWHDSSHENGSPILTFFRYISIIYTKQLPFPSCF